MPSTKAPKKRSSPPRRSDHTKAFEKDWQRLQHSGRHDLARLKEPMLLLIANDGPLASEWLDHELKGEWADHRELHAKGDLLLIYRLEGDQVIYRLEGDQVIYVRAGTHSELFGS